MIIVEELTAEFQIKLSAELVNSLSDHIGLRFEILFIAEADFHRCLLDITYDFRLISHLFNITEGAGRCKDILKFGNYRARHGGSQPRIKEGAFHHARRGRNAEAFLISYEF